MPDGVSAHLCETCVWFARGDYREYVHRGVNSYQPGTCNLNPPTEKGFARTTSVDFCGQHSARQNTPEAGRG